MSTRTYDPGEMHASVSGISVSAWGPDTFLEAEFNEDAFIPAMGAGGEAARARSRDQSGRVRFTLLASSPENDLLSALAIIDRTRGEGVGPLFVKDNLGTTIISAQNAYIIKMPDIEYSREVGTRTWEFYCPVLDVFEGGSVLPPSLF